MGDVPLTDLRAHFSSAKKYASIEKIGLLPKWNFCMRAIALPILNTPRTMIRLSEHRSHFNMSFGLPTLS